MEDYKESPKQKEWKRVGVIGNEPFVVVVPYHEAEYHRVTFINAGDKLKISHLDWTVWGYNGYRPYLPLDIIEKTIQRYYPGCVFVDGNVEVMV